MWRSCFPQFTYWFLVFFGISHESNVLEPGLQRDLTPPYVDDGLIEVVGFRDAWHGLVLLAPNGHGTRLAQVILIYLSDYKIEAFKIKKKVDECTSCLIAHFIALQHPCTPLLEVLYPMQFFVKHVMLLVNSVLSHDQNSNAVLPTL